MPKLGKVAWIGGALAIVAAAPLLAAPKDDVTARVNGLRELGAAFKAVNDALKSSAPQPTLIQISARQIVAASRAQYHWFPAGSGPQAGVKTSAKPEIWTQPAPFKAAQDAFAMQAGLFQKTAAGGDIAAVRTQAKALGATCGACHRTFRTDDH